MSGTSVSTPQVISSKVIEVRYSSDKKGKNGLLQALAKSVRTTQTYRVLKLRCISLRDNWSVFGLGQRNYPVETWSNLLSHKMRINQLHAAIGALYRYAENFTCDAVCGSLRLTSASSKKIRILQRRLRASGTCYGSRKPIVLPRLSTYRLEKPRKRTFVAKQENNELRSAFTKLSDLL